jgi:signal transduction histidine kinase
MLISERRATNALLSRNIDNRDFGWGSADDSDGATNGSNALLELCHDVRQPAAAIGAIVAAVEMESDLSPTARHWLRQITLEARRVSDLCDDALGRRTGAGMACLSELAAEVADAASLASLATVTFDGEPVVVKADPVALRRVLWNLVENAVRAAGPGGQVRVTTRPSGSEVEIVVADSGPGFGRGDTGVAGLGLRIVGRVVRGLGGQIHIATSRDLGGAEVTVTLPSPGWNQMREGLAP